MFGVIDANMDCGTQGSTLQPYPQYYAYELLGGSNYLNIVNGGHVANVASSNLSGVYVAGFYTQSRGSLVIVNTTSTSYTTLNILAQHPRKVNGSQSKVYTDNFN